MQGKYLSTSEAASVLGLSPVTLWAWAKSGKISSVRIGRNFRVSKWAVDALVAELEEIK